MTHDTSRPEDGRGALPDRKLRYDPDVAEFQYREAKAFYDGRLQAFAAEDAARLSAPTTFQPVAGGEMEAVLATLSDPATILKMLRGEAAVPTLAQMLYLWRGTMDGDTLAVLEAIVTGDAPAPPVPVEPERGSAAASDVLAERERQQVVEGWTAAHDDSHAYGDLALAAAAYAVDAVDMGGTSMIARRLWPWAAKWWKPMSRRRNLVRAGALILAEIERMDRATLASGGRS